MEIYSHTKQIYREKVKNIPFKFFSLATLIFANCWFGNYCSLYEYVGQTAEQICRGWHDAVGGVFSERRGFKVVLQWNEWYASDPVLQPDLD